MKRTLEKNTARRRRQRLTLDEIHFDLSFTNDHSFSIESLGRYKISRNDTVYYKICVQPPVSQQEARDFTLRLTHEPSRLSNVFIRWMLDDRTFVKENVLDRRFLVYPSHVLELDRNEKTESISTLFFTVENCQMRGDDDTPDIRLVIDLGIEFFPSIGLDEKRFQGLGFFPADAEVNGQDIDYSKIPQRTPLWFKMRGEITGSRVPFLLGFYVPNPETASERRIQQFRDEFNGLVKKPIVGKQAVDMRFGRTKEWNIIMTYLANFPDRKFQEVGYVPYAANPQRWGASPDGILYDPTEKTPKGAAEFKASRFDSDFKSTYFPQLLWEMMSLEVQWGDLVRYQEKQVYDKESKTIRVHKKCRVIRVYRGPEIEEKMVLCLKKSSKEKDADEFMKLVHTPEFAYIRSHFETMCQVADSEAIELDVPQDDCKNIAAYQDSFTSAEQMSFIEQIDQRHAQIMNNVAKQKIDSLRDIVINQIQELCELLRY